MFDAGAFEGVFISEQTRVFSVRFLDSLAICFFFFSLSLDMVRGLLLDSHLHLSLVVRQDLLRDVIFRYASHYLRKMISYR